MRFKFGKKSILLKEQEHWKLKKQNPRNYEFSLKLGH